MSIDWSRPLTEFAKCVMVPLARFAGRWCHDLLCYHKVIKELESAARTLKDVHADIEGTVNAARAQGQLVNEGRSVSVWLRQAEGLIKQLEELKRDSTVESDGKFFLMMCLCTRCCNCGEAQKKIKRATALITEAKTFILPLVRQAQSGGHSKTHERSWGEALVRSSSTPALLIIIDDRLEAKAFVLVRSSSTPAIPMIADDQPEMKENL